MYKLIQYDKYESIAIIQLNHQSRTNPLSQKIKSEIMDAMMRADTDSQIKGIICHGGEGRSFSAGGDFNEVKLLTEPDSICGWIDRVIDFYISILKLSKPTLSLVHQHAIGMGFQFALMFDYCLASQDAKFTMPELKHGIGCSLGYRILDLNLSYKAMKNIVYGCEPIYAEEALQYDIVNKIVGNNHLEECIEFMQEKVNYPHTAFHHSKKLINEKYITLLESCREESKSLHIHSFMGLEAQKHFNKVLKEEKYA